MKPSYKSALKELEEMTLKAMARRKRGAPEPKPSAPEVEMGEALGAVAGLKVGEAQGIEAPEAEDFASLLDKHTPEEKKRLAEMYSKLMAKKG